MRVVVSEVRFKISCSQFLYAERREETVFFYFARLARLAKILLLETGSLRGRYG